ncbi:capsular polysaccharide biosynthesis protein [Clostridia bacterium]|nr:capsular polysaccharide biosynthesis protein [Clostridia bacterium]
MFIPFSPPDITELEIDEVIDTLKSGWITTGKRTKLFERKLSEYIDTNCVVCLNSQTAAAEMTLRILGIGPGDEVIVPAYTYSASASVIDHVGAKIIMLDTSKDSFELDYDAIEGAITSKTKAIIPVDIGGRMCDYSRIYDSLNNKRKLYSANNDLQALFGRVIVIADSAHGFGAKKNGLNSGQVADFTTFSFHAVKNLTTGEGGAVTWRNDRGLDDDQLYRQFMLLSLHGQTKDALNKSQLGSWEYDIDSLAYKCNMTDLQAAIGLKQLERYGNLRNRRKQIINMYDAAFIPNGLQSLTHYDEYNSSSGHLYLLRIPDISVGERNSIIKQMAEAGISCNVHYKPLPMMSGYQRLGFTINNFPNAYCQYQNEITLPLHTLLSDEEVFCVEKQITDLIVNKYYKHVN